MNELEQKRDDVCIPVAKAIMSEMGSELVRQDGDHKDLALKSISLMLNSDLNIDTEVSYVPQLILRSLSEMNALMESSNVVPLDDERYISIAHKILTLLSEANISMGEMSVEDMAKEVAPFKDKLNALIEEEKLTKLEVTYIKEMIFTSFTGLNNMIQNSIANATKKAEEKALGIESMTDLTLKKLDEFLKG